LALLPYKIKTKNQEHNYFGIITTKFVLVEVQTAVAGSLTFKFFLENIEFEHVKKKRISRILSIFFIIILYFLLFSTMYIKNNCQFAVAHKSQQLYYNSYYDYNILPLKIVNNNINTKLKTLPFYYIVCD